jgi:predicted enzyme related to lactoylglutathione lyase
VPQFRFLYHSRKFDETVAFWADQVGLEQVGGWDEGDDRGAMFAAADGIVEVMYSATAPSITDPVYLVYEVEDVERWHATAVGRGAPAGRSPEDVPWGHREASLLDPNGLIVTCFTKLSSAAG